MIVTADTGYIVAIVISALAVVMFIIATGLINGIHKRNLGYGLHASRIFGSRVENPVKMLQQKSATTYTGLVLSIAALIISVVLFTSAPQIKTVMNGLILAFVISAFFLLWSILCAALLHRFPAAALSLTVMVILAVIGVFVAAIYIAAIESSLVARPPGANSFANSVGGVVVT